MSARIVRKNVFWIAVFMTVLFLYNSIGISYGSSLPSEFPWLNYRIHPIWLASIIELLGPYTIDNFLAFRFNIQFHSFSFMGFIAFLTAVSLYNRKREISLKIISFMFSLVFLSCVVNILSFIQLSLFVLDQGKLFEHLANHYIIVLLFFLMLSFVLLREDEPAITKTTVNKTLGPTSKPTRAVHYAVDCLLIFTLVGVVKDFLGMYWPKPLMHWSLLSAIIISKLFYYYLFECLFSRTCSKYATGTIVVSIQNKSPSKKQIFIRTIARMIPFEMITFLFNYNLHDKWSGTNVVKIMKRE